MAIDKEKQMQEWKAAVTKYRECLEAAAHRIRELDESALSHSALAAIKKDIGVVNRAGSSFKDDVGNAAKLVPIPPSPKHSGYKF